MELLDTSCPIGGMGPWLTLQGKNNVAQAALVSQRTLLFGLGMTCQGGADPSCRSQ